RRRRPALPPPPDLDPRRPLREEQGDLSSAEQRLPRRLAARDPARAGRANLDQPALSLLRGRDSTAAQRRRLRAPAEPREELSPPADPQPELAPRALGRPDRRQPRSRRVFGLLQAASRAEQVPAHDQREGHDQ